MTSDTLHELQRTVKRLVRRPGYTALVTLVLATGLGAVTVVGSVVHAFLLRPLPYADPDRLVRLQATRGGDEVGTSFPEYRDFAEGAKSFEGLALFSPSWLANLRLPDGHAAVPGVLATANFFDVLGVGPARGRLFTPDDATADAELVAVLSHGLAARLYGTGDVLGRRLPIGDDVFTVVGVMPPGFAYPVESELWVVAERWFNRENRFRRIDKVLGRLAPGTSVDAARAEIGAIAAGLAERHPDSNRGVGATVVAERELLTAELRPSLLFVFGACAFLLLLAAANVANLALVRHEGRRGELAVRRALGAGRGRLLAELGLESLVLAFASGALGLLLAAWGLDAASVLWPGGAPFWVRFELTPQVVLVHAAAALALGTLVTLLPAAAALRLPFAAALTTGTRTDGGGRRSRRVLVVAEVALALVLVLGAGLVWKGLEHLRRLDPGFEPTRAITVGVNYSLEASRDERGALLDEAMRRLLALPQVEAVGATSALPLTGVETWDRLDPVLEGQSEEEALRNPRVDLQWVSSGYFEAMGTPLLRGRVFRDGETFGDARPVVVSRRLAEHFWPGDEALGQRFQTGGRGSDWPTWEVVGIAADVRQEGPLRDAVPGLYAPFTVPAKEMHLVARSSGPPAALTDAVRREIGELSPYFGVHDVAILADRLHGSIWRPRLEARLLGAFAVLALGLAAAGIYGVVAVTVARRTREIGVRMAVGARTADVFRLVLGEVAALASVGVAAGLAASLALERVVESELVGVGVLDPLVVSTVVTMLLGTAFLAALVPARRAAAIDPVAAVRAE